MSEAQQGKLEIKEDRPVDSVEEYQFEPIKGYPMLNWRGKRPFTSTQYYPAQLKETHGPEVEGWRNKILWGDNLQVMSHLLKNYRGKVKLAYIDPPFDSNADYKKSIQLKGRKTHNDYSGFEEKQYSDIWNNDEYLQYIYERIVLLKELLSDDGSIYFHLNTKVNSYVRLILDEVFGPDYFQAEVVWKKIRVVKAQSKFFGNVHDAIYLYTKSHNAVFNKQYIPQSNKYKEKFNKVEPETNRRYQLVSLLQAGQGPPRKFGDIVLDPGVDRHWIWSQERIDQAMESGLIEITSGGTPRKKQYLDETKGKRVGDIWTDIYPVNSQALEDTGYPTQKPIALLERIIKASSNQADLVFDCFMGSGTTQAVAMKLGRRFIGADINLGAVQITTKRLLGVAEEIKENNQQKEMFAEQDEDPPSTFYPGFEVYNVNHYDVFRNPVEARDLLLEALEVHKLPQGHLFDGEKDGRMVKIMPVNRIATRADLNELIGGFDYKAFEKRQSEKPTLPVEKVTLVCMGHEPDLKAVLEAEVHPYKLDVEVVDILRDKQDLQFKRDSEAKINIQGGHLVIERFYPMNLLQKLSLQKEKVADWRELVESIMIDWNYDGAVLQPGLVDIPEKNELVSGKYRIPAEAGTIRVKITDLLSESLEVEVAYG